jgi:hypothetical protein
MPIPMTQAHYDLVHRLADEDGQPENMLEFRNILNEIEPVELIEFMGPSGDDDSNASDDDFIHDKSYQQEFDDQELEKIEHLADHLELDEGDLNLDNENQQDHFQHPSTAPDNDSDDVDTDYDDSPVPNLDLDSLSTHSDHNSDDESNSTESESDCDSQSEYNNSVGEIDTITRNGAYNDPNDSDVATVHPQLVDSLGAY